MVELTAAQRRDLLAMVNGVGVSARSVTRARIVLWRAEGRLKKDVALLAGVSRPTVDAALVRFEVSGVAGLKDQPVRVVGRERVPVRVRARILALTRTSPPAETGLSHWSSREWRRFFSAPKVSRCHTTMWPRCGVSMG
jgi:hypothetical protein